MRVVRRSPLLRTALLSLVVLFAHTGRAAKALPIAPLAPPSAGKVAAAQPNPEKKFNPANKRIVRPGRLAHHYTSIGGSIGFTATYAASLSFTHHAGQIALARRAINVAPQRRPFALRI